MILRLLFRILLAFTLLVMFYARSSGGALPTWAAVPFYDWFLVSVVLFSAFGIWAAYRAFSDSLNRRAWLTDVVLAAIWIPYWYTNLH